MPPLHETRCLTHIANNSRAEHYWDKSSLPFDLSLFLSLRSDVQLAWSFGGPLVL